MQTYFSTEILAFFETLLQIRRPVLLGNELLADASMAGVEARSVTHDGGGTGTASSVLVGDEPLPVHPPSFRKETEGKAAAAGAGAATGACAGASGAGGLEAERRGACGADFSIPVPPRGQFDMLRVTSRRFWGKRYDLLARELILDGAMPLGLYRPARTKGNSLPYTQVNPSVSERLVRGDIVFVLRSRSCSLVGSV